MKKQRTYKFKKGQKIHLDEIYNIQGVTKIDWWEREDDISEELTVTHDVKITIIEEHTL